MKEMVNNIRFRNHISIVIERLGRAILILGAVFVGNLLPELDTIVENLGNLKENLMIVLLASGGILAILALLLIWQVIVWSKTYISIQDQTIVIEQNTLNRKKNTIGIKNISNVNTEQNLFEMLLGTYKVKLDTNSLSTADKTDVKIVLKKAQAEWFKNAVMSLMEETPGKIPSENAADRNTAAKPNSSTRILRTDLGDILKHGLFSVSIFSVLLAIASFTGSGFIISRELSNGIAAGKSLFGIFSSVVIFISLGASAVWDTLRDFIKYFDFQVERIENKIHIHYGLFKKVNYTIPIDKINAVKLNQTLIARIFGHYMVELVNVGMGDDGGERKSFFLLYHNRSFIEDKLHALLPEFADCMDIQETKQPKKVWLVWSLPFLIYTAFATIIPLILSNFYPECSLWFWMGSAGISLLCLFSSFCWYFTAGVGMGDYFLMLARGYGAKSRIYIRYDKIQYLKLKQNFLARACHIQSGEAYVLAASTNRVQPIPYFPEDLAEKLKNHTLAPNRHHKVY